MSVFIDIIDKIAEKQHTKVHTNEYKAHTNGKIVVIHRVIHRVIHSKKAYLVKCLNVFFKISVDKYVDKYVDKSKIGNCMQLYAELYAAKTDENCLILLYISFY